MLFVDLSELVLPPPEFKLVHAAASAGSEWATKGGRVGELLENFQVCVFPWCVCVCVCAFVFARRSQWWRWG